MWFRTPKHYKEEPYFSSYPLIKKVIHKGMSLNAKIWQAFPMLSYIPIIVINYAVTASYHRRSSEIKIFLSSELGLLKLEMK